MSNATIQQHAQAMQQAFRPDKAGGLNVTYQLDVTGRVNASLGISIQNGQATVSPSRPNNPNTVIRLSDANYLKLAEGKLDVRQAFQQGQIQVQGDTNLALKFVELFNPWAGLIGQAAPSPQPKPAAKPQRKPQPQPPAQPKSTPATSGVTPADYVRAMPHGLRRDKAGGVNLTYQFRLTGFGGGDWTVRVANQQATVSEGRQGQPNVVIEMDTSRFVELAEGRLNTTKEYQQGRIKIDGDRNLAARIGDLFGKWSDKVGQPVPSQPSSPAPAPSQPTPSQPSTPSPAQPEIQGEVYPRLMNGSFDEYQPYVRDGEAKVWKENQFPERIGKYWTLELIKEKKGRFHPMDSATFGKFTQKYFGGGGLDYHIHGAHSQVITSRFAFDLVFYQTVAAQPGREYTLSGSIVSFYKGTSGERADGKVFKTIGVDPTGGRVWNSSSVVWANRDGKDNEWRYPSLKVKAQANAITVFIRLENTEKDVGSTELNTIHLENFELK